MDIILALTKELNVEEWQIEAAVKLIDEGNTIPFISRYRKEVTGALNDEVLRNLNDRLTYLRNLEEKKTQVLSSIEEQGKLTEELKKQILEAQTLVVVEDLYRPYRPKRRTRATIAKEKGLEPLANIILLQMTDKSLEEEAKAFVSEEKEVATVEAAISGAKDIVAESISDKADYRSEIRERTFRKGMLVSTAKKPEETSVYEKYYEYEERVEKMPGHRVLAINRGEKEKFLKVKIDKPEDKILEFIQLDIIKGKTQFTEHLENTILDSWKRLIEPSIDREIRADLTEKAEEQAIKVFGKNAKQLLLGAPLKGLTVLGFDPAYRTGCKLAVIDETGKVLDTGVVYPTEPQNDIEGATKELIRLIKKDNINMIAIGNGTASRESEMFVSDVIKKIKEEYGVDVYYAIVSEAGASVYSASKLATEEYPDLNVSLRGAISIARRLQDPLAELVKIDPKAIGVGQYQHDVNQKRLDESLTGVVENVVNNVGVDINTATPSLLSYVSGVNKQVATNIVKYREENGKFNSRKEFLKVPKLGKAAFVQCAGFLKVPESKNILDNTMVHPESYEKAEELISSLGFNIKNLTTKNMGEVISKLDNVNIDNISKTLNIGSLTMQDIVTELKKPGRDPRDEMPKIVVKSDVLSIDDITEGMILTGTVRNVVDFGAFVDVGIKNDGLVHISEISDKYVRNPMEEVAVGDIVKVKVIGIDKAKGKVSLSMKGVEK